MQKVCSNVSAFLHVLKCKSECSTLTQTNSYNSRSDHSLCYTCIKYNREMLFLLIIFCFFYTPVFSAQVNLKIQLSLFQTVAFWYISFSHSSQDFKIRTWSQRYQCLHMSFGMLQMLHFGFNFPKSKPAYQIKHI